MGAHAAPTIAPGRRERKKRQTRHHIAATALTLFLERGFSQTPVSRVAEAADVSEQTVFNHFPAKEDLVFGPLQEWEDDLLAEVRDRAAGVSVLGAYRAALFTRGGLLTQPGPEARAKLVALNAMIEETPVLRRREQELFLARTDALAQLVETAEGPGSVRAWVIANALVGVHRALVMMVRASLADGLPSAVIAERVAHEGQAAVDLLVTGLGSHDGDTPPRTGAR